MSEFITICEKAARAGGEVLRKWQGKITPQEKQPRDLVTEADLESQNVIQTILLDAFPEHQFVGEEDSSPADTSKSGYRWIVDPLDGTTNYVHQLQTYSVSIALEKDGELLCGTVFDPVVDECYLAEKGKGATLNGQRLKVSPCKELNQALVAASFSASVPRGSKQVDYFLAVLHECQALRRLGSCALNLCYLAAGRLDGYWATSVNAWDVAAGVLIVREAGGIVTDVDGGPFSLWQPKFATAATPELHKQLVNTLQQAN